MKNKFNLICPLMFNFSYTSIANAVIINFEDAFIAHNYLVSDIIEDGFRMRVLSGHYDTHVRDGSVYLNIDTMGADSFGPISRVRFERDGGGLFDITNLEVIQINNGFGLNGYLTSSASGSLSLDTSGIVDFSGPDWSNISWLDFAVGPRTPDADSISAGIDNLHFTSVAEPASLILFISGLIMSICVLLRQKQQVM